MNIRSRIKYQMVLYKFSPVNFFGRIVWNVRLLFFEQSGRGKGTRDELTKLFGSGGGGRSTTLKRRPVGCARIRIFVVTVQSAIEKWARPSVGGSDAAAAPVTLGFPPYHTCDGRDAYA